MAMYVIAICVAGLCLLVFGLLRAKRLREQRELEQYSIEPEALHALMETDRDVLIFDVRQPLDLLAHSEIIPTATRVPPKELMEHTSLIPRERDSVVYCTCESDETSREILHKALALNFSRIKFLRGGLEAWKAKGYAVERYDKPFRLDTAS
jgi:rhodanese-related sulfurtransferase